MKMYFIFLTYYYCVMYNIIFIFKLLIFKLLFNLRYLLICFQFLQFFCCLDSTIHFLLVKNNNKTFLQYVPGGCMEMKISVHPIYFYHSVFIQLISLVFNGLVGQFSKALVITRRLFFFITKICYITPVIQVLYSV